MEISISKADTHVGDLIAAMKKAGFNPAKVKMVGTVAAYECNNWNLDKMKSVMQSAGWEPQGVNNKLFPNKEGSYYIQKTDCEELAVIELDADGVFYIEFSGY